MKTAPGFFFAVLLAIPHATAQYTFFTPDNSFTVEVSLDNSPYLRLPIYRNAITSLAVVGDYAIGGTTANPGLSPYLFAVSLSKRQLEIVFPLETILPRQRSIQSGFARGAAGLLYTGTMPDRAGDSGHILAIQVKGTQLDVKDLGAPVSGEGIFALTADAKTGVLYGVSHPSGKFFDFHPNDKSTQVYGQAFSDRRTRRILGEFSLKPEDVLSRRLIVDRQGRVYGSQPVNQIFRFDPAPKKFELLPGELPEVWGRRSLGRADAWAMAPDGSLYGGNAADGQIFRIDTSTGHITNLGKPIMMPRVKGLAFASDGKLYGVAGSSPGYAHLFRYSPSDGFVDLGNPRFPMVESGLETDIPWRGFQIGTLAVSEDGRYVVMGEDEALSQLMVFRVD